MDVPITKITQALNGGTFGHPRTSTCSKPPSSLSMGYLTTVRMILRNPIRGINTVAYNPSMEAPPVDDTE